MLSTLQIEQPEQQQPEEEQLEIKPLEFIEEAEFSRFYQAAEGNRALVDKFYQEQVKGKY